MDRHAAKDTGHLDAIADAHHERTGDQAVLLAALLLAEEAGEAVQQTRRFMGRARSTATAADVAAELADVLISAAILARLLDVDLEEAMDSKLSLGIRE
ncbi:MAG: MazG nucleotide pyrophosphohydrolase domain-containing protein [Candidatus Limnocylindrales bacterium]